MVIELPILLLFHRNYIFTVFAVQCSPLSSLQNGNISLQSDGVTTISSYTCGPGYTLKGVEVGTCGDDGSWSIVSSPSCGK